MAFGVSRSGGMRPFIENFSSAVSKVFCSKRTALFGNKAAAVIVRSRRGIPNAKGYRATYIAVLGSLLCEAVQALKIGYLLSRCCES